MPKHSIFDKTDEHQNSIPEPWSGAFLRSTRESRNLSIKQISEITRIRRGLVEAIENEYYEMLPAQAFIRGHLIQISKALDLPEEELVRNYMSRITERS